MNDDRRGGTLLLRPVGRLDRDTCGELRHQLGAAFAAGVQSIAVDLRDVTVADVEGLRVLAGAARHLRSRGGALVVSRADAAITRALRINGMAELLDVAASPPLRVLPAASPQRSGRRATARQGALTVVRPTDDGVAVPG